MARTNPTNVCKVMSRGRDDDSVPSPDLFESKSGSVTYLQGFRAKCLEKFKGVERKNQFRDPWEKPLEPTIGHSQSNIRARRT